MEKDGILSSAMPLCKEEDLSYFFYQMVDYFDNVLHKPFYISLADAEAVEYLNLDPEKFEVTELDDLKSAEPGSSYTYKRRASPLTEDLWLYLRAVPHHDPSNGIKRVQKLFQLWVLTLR